MAKLTVDMDGELAGWLKGRAKVHKVRPGELVRGWIQGQMLAERMRKEIQAMRGGTRRTRRWNTVGAKR